MLPITGTYRTVKKRLPHKRSLLAGMQLGVGAALLLNIALPRASFAEPSGPRVGRNADGSPYRVDSSGFRLTDELAEAQVSVGELERKVLELEDELKKKNEQLATKGGRSMPSAPCAQCPTPSCSSVQSAALPALPPARTATQDPQTLCAPLVQESSRRVSELESSLRSCQNGQRTPSCDFASTANPLWEQVQRLQSQLSEATARASAATDALKSQQQTAERERSELQAKLDAAINESSHSTEISPENSSSRAALALKHEPATDTAAAASSTAIERSSPAEEKVEEQAKTEERAEEKKTASRASESSPPVPATFRKELREKEQRINGLISDRKVLLDSAKLKKKGITISAQTLQTSAGRSLDSLRAGIKECRSKDEAESISSGLDQIENILKDDIGVLTRLTKK